MCVCACVCGRRREGRGGGGGGGGADTVYGVRVCPCTPTIMQIIKMDQCQCTGPFGWTDQPETSHACSLRRQVPGVSSAKLTQPQGEEKDCEARPLHLPLLRRKGAQSFPSPRRWMPWIRIMRNQYTWTCLPGQPDPLYIVTTIIGQVTRSNIPSFTTTISNPREGGRGREREGRRGEGEEGGNAW